MTFNLAYLYLNSTFAKSQLQGRMLLDPRYEEARRRWQEVFLPGTDAFFQQAWAESNDSDTLPDILNRAVELHDGHCGYARPTARF